MFFFLSFCVIIIWCIGYTTDNLAEKGQFFISDNGITAACTHFIASLGVYFMVGLTESKAFSNPIKFDKIITARSQSPVLLSTTHSPV